MSEVLDEYHHYDHMVPTPPSVKKRLQELIGNKEGEKWLRMVPYVTAIRDNEFPFTIPVILESGQKDLTLSWILTQEDGSIMTGSQQVGNCNLFSENNGLEERLLPINVILPTGYHRLRIKFTGKAPQNTNREVSIIVAPQTCYIPEGIENRCFGFSVQLYSLKSDNNWGIGDFSDLKNFITQVEKLGADFVGLNPLNSLFIEDPEFASPYSPSSRTFLNHLYIDITKVDGYSSNVAVKEYVASKEFKEKLKKARNSDTIDYATVSEIKLKILRLLYDDFLEKEIRNKTPKSMKFKDFAVNKGGSLDRIATFQALSVHFNKPHTHGFSHWEKEYQTYDTKEVKEFAAKYKKEIGFYLYLQWVADMQYTDCTKNKMKIGIYMDLPIGVSSESASVWSDPELFICEASIGAPPDHLAPQGQSWGIPPMKTSELRKRRFQPYIDMLRFNMKYAGAMRIDHVMAIVRIYTVLPDNSGAYITCPTAEMLAILALESHRNKCMVIGENLGTVPYGFNEIIEKNNILGMKIFRDLGDYELHNFPLYKNEPKNLITFGTHDMPTLYGLWSGSYYEELMQIGISTKDEMKKSKAELRHWKIRLIEAMAKRGIWFNNDEDVLKEDHFPPLLPLAVYKYMSYSPCYVLSVNIEDLTGQANTINIPGTTHERPNWRHKLDIYIDEIGKDERITKVCDILRTR